LVGAMIPAMVRIVVVLPAPFGPTSAGTSPGRTSNDNPSTAWSCLYDFEKSSTTSALTDSSSSIRSTG
jgi:hypothetical protein